MALLEPPSSTATANRTQLIHNSPQRMPQVRVFNAWTTDHANDGATSTKLLDSVAGPSSIIQATANPSVEVSSACADHPARCRRQHNTAMTVPASTCKTM